MVYNGTDSDLNTSLWASHCVLTTVWYTLWEVERGTYMAEQYIGEIFINFMMSEEVRPFFGIDMTNV